MNKEFQSQIPLLSIVAIVAIVAIVGLLQTTSSTYSSSESSFSPPENILGLAIAQYESDPNWYYIYDVETINQWVYFRNVLVFDYNLSEERVLNGSWFYLYQIIVEDGDSAWFYKFDSSKWVFLNDRNTFSFWAYDNDNQEWRYFTKLPSNQAYMYMNDDFLFATSGDAPDVTFTDANCYDPKNVNTIGSWSGCDGMLIVNNAMLRRAGSNCTRWDCPGGNGNFFITSSDGVKYTFENSDYNIFTGQVTDMSSLFQSSSFNGDINYWDVSRVTKMRSMFSGSSSFDQPLNNWDVSSVTDMAYMFNGATSFNQYLREWNINAGANIQYMFWGANSFHDPAITFTIISREEKRNRGAIRDYYERDNLNSFCNYEAKSRGFTSGTLAPFNVEFKSGGNHCRGNFFRIIFSHNKYELPAECFSSPRNDFARVYVGDRVYVEAVFCDSAGYADCISSVKPGNRLVQPGATIYCIGLN